MKKSQLSVRLIFSIFFTLISPLLSAQTSPCINTSLATLKSLKAFNKDPIKVYSLFLNQSLPQTSTGIKQIAEFQKFSSTNQAVDILQSGFLGAGVSQYQFKTTPSQYTDIENFIKNAIKEPEFNLSAFSKNPSLYHTGNVVNTNAPLKPETPHIWENGCIREAQSADFATLDKTATYAMNYSGFSEVAMIGKVQTNAKTNIKTYQRTCSAVIIGKQHLLTANHCIKSIEKNDSRYAIFWGKRKGLSGDLLFESCNPANQDNSKCPRYVASMPLSSFKLFPNSSNVTISASDISSTTITAVTPDIAVIKFQATASNIVQRFAKISPTESIGITHNGKDSKNWLTAIGYGLSDIAAENELSGGPWMSLNATSIVDNSSGNFAVLKNDNPQTTRFCRMDSGGPVFTSFYNGAELASNQRTVGALVAFGWEKDSRINCKSSPASGVQLITSEVYKWICQQNTKTATIAGCDG